MKWIKFFLTPSVFLIFTTIACNFDFDQDVVIPPQKSVLAIETQFALGEEPLVLVTRTRSIGEPIKWDFNYGDIIDTMPNGFNIRNNSDLYDTVKNVTVQLFEADNLIRTFRQDNPYTKVAYVADAVNYKKNVEYTLKVFAPGFDTVIGKQKPPSQVDLKKVTFAYNNVSNSSGSRLSELAMEFDDIPNEDNYYTVDVYFESLSWQKKRISRPLKPIKVDNAATNNIYLNDKTFDGQKHTWRIGLAELYEPSFQKDSAELKVYFRSISKDYTLYKLNAEINAAAEQSDFTEPASTYTNLTGGLGVFAIFGYPRVYTIKLYK